jgi:hypothetical protein
VTPLVPPDAGAAPSLERLPGRPLTPLERDLIRRLISQKQLEQLAVEAAHHAKVLAADARKRP